MSSEGENINFSYSTNNPVCFSINEKAAEWISVSGDAVKGPEGCSPHCLFRQLFSITLQRYLQIFVGAFFVSHFFIFLQSNIDKTLLVVFLLLSNLAICKPEEVNEIRTSQPVVCP